MENISIKTKINRRLNPSLLGLLYREINIGFDTSIDVKRSNMAHGFDTPTFGNFNNT